MTEAAGDRSDDTTARLDAVVMGRVQGVGFRYYVVREARRLGLDGWTANEGNGSVRVVADGPRDTLETLLDVLREGPPASIVEQVVVNWPPVSSGGWLLGRGIEFGAVRTAGTDPFGGRSWDSQVIPIPGAEPHHPERRRRRSLGDRSPAELLPALYRSVLDEVAALERRGERVQAAQFRDEAIRAYSRSWDATGDRRLESILRRAERALADAPEPAQPEVVQPVAEATPKRPVASTT